MNFVVTILAAATLTLQSTAWAKDSSELAIGRELTVPLGTVLESVVAVGATVKVEGTIGGLIAVGSRVELTDTAKITEELVSVGSTIQRAPGAEVAKEETLDHPPFMRPEFIKALAGAGFLFPSMLMFSAWHAIGSFLSILILGWLYLSIFPEFNSRVLDYVDKNPVGAMGFGALAWICLIPGMLLLIVTLVGILILPLYFLLFGTLVFAGYFTGGYWIVSKKLLAQGNRPMSHLLLATGALLAVLHVIPVAGSIALFVLSLAGFGAIVRSLFYRVKAPTT